MKIRSYSANYHSKTRFISLKKLDVEKLQNTEKILYCEAVFGTKLRTKLASVTEGASSHSRHRYTSRRRNHCSMLETLLFYGNNITKIKVYKEKNIL